MPRTEDHSMPARCHCEHLSWALRDLNRIEDAVKEVNTINVAVAKLLVDNKRIERLGWAVLALVFTVFGAIIINAYVATKPLAEEIPIHPGEVLAPDRAMQ